MQIAKSCCSILSLRIKITRNERRAMKSFEAITKPYHYCTHGLCTSVDLMFDFPQSKTLDFVRIRLLLQKARSLIDYKTLMKSRLKRLAYRPNTTANVGQITVTEKRILST